MFPNPHVAQALVQAHIDDLVRSAPRRRDGDADRHTRWAAAAERLGHLFGRTQRAASAPCPALRQASPAGGLPMGCRA